jgi:transposase InsO family protein
MSPDLARYPSFKGEKLKGADNYATWAFTFRVYLQGREAADLIDDEFAKSVQGNQVYSELVAALEASVVVEIIGSSTAFQAWKCLRERYAAQSTAHVVMIAKALRSKEFRGDNLEEYLLEMRRMHQALKAAGGIMTDQEFIRTLLTNIVADHMMMIVTVLANGDPNILTINETCSRLLVEDQRLGARKRSPRESLLFSGDRVKPRQTTRTENRKCYRCQKVGHIAVNCTRNERETAKKAYCDSGDEAEYMLSAAVSRDVRHCSRRKAPISKDELKQESVCSRDAHWIAEASACDEEYLWADSGATRHMCGNRSRIKNYQKLAVPVEVVLGDDRTMQAIGKGSLHVIALDGTRLTLTNVLYVPNVATGLFSISAVCDAGATDFSFTKHCCSMRVAGKVINIGRRVGRLYKIALPVQEAAYAAVSKERWHCRRGHINYKALDDDVKNGTVNGMDMMGGTPDACGYCEQGKATRRPMPVAATRRAHGVNDLVHSDLIGPMSVTSPAGKKYVLTFIDDHSRYTSVYFLSAKSDVFDKFRQYKDLMEKQHERPIKCIRSDNGGEYLDAHFQDYLTNHGIMHEFSVPRRQAQNGVAERMGRTLMEMARTVLFQAKMAKTWWAEAIQTAAYLRNRSNTKALPRDQTPYEMLFGRKPDLSHLRVFGCLVMYKNDKAKKLDERAKPGIMVGYSPVSKGYRIIDQQTKKLVVTRDVKFWEERFDTPDCAKEDSACDDDDADQVSTDERDEEEQPIAEVSRRSSRLRGPPKPYWMTEMINLANTADEPRSRREALSLPDANEWQAAIEEELVSLEKNETWRVIARPTNRKVIDGRWVFKAKKDEDGNLARYKARYVARGYSQVPGVDYVDTYSPVAATDSQRIVLSKVAAENLEAYQVDIETSFQHQKVREELYIELPEGFAFPPGTKRATHCGRLIKALYGLKQAAFELNDRLTKLLVEAGYVFANADACVFYRRVGTSYLIATMHIDDMLVATTDKDMYEQLVRTLGKQFPIKDLGSISHLLGCKIVRDRGARMLSISQGAYARDVITRFNMQGAKPVSTPSSTSIQLRKCSVQDSEIEFPYREAVGSLMYLAVMTRPDLAEAVNAVARFVDHPTPIHVVAVKRILRYLKGTLDHGICFHGPNDLIVYCDSNWAADQDDRRSTSGMLAMMNGGTIAYFSRKQKSVALSSSEAEYIAASEAARAVVCLRNLLKELPGVPLKNEPTIVYEDNQGCIAMANAEGLGKRAKHIDVRVHYLRETIKKGDIELRYLPTHEMLADMLTKPIPRDKHEQHRKAMNVIAHCSGGVLDESDANHICETMP